MHIHVLPRSQLTFNLGHKTHPQKMKHTHKHNNTYQHSNNDRQLENYYVKKLENIIRQTYTDTHIYKY